MGRDASTLYDMGFRAVFIEGTAFFDCLLFVYLSEGL